MFKKIQGGFHMFKELIINKLNRQKAESQESAEVEATDHYIEKCNKVYRNTPPLSGAQLYAISIICRNLNIMFLEPPTKVNASIFIGNHIEESKEVERMRRIQEQEED